MKKLIQSTTALALVLTMAACTTTGLTSTTASKPQATEVRATNPVPTTAPKKSKALYMTLIASLAADGKHRAALAYLDDFDTRWPNDPNAISIRADQHLALRELRTAALEYQKLRRFDANAKADAGLGRVAGALGKWDRAVTYLSRAVRQHPANASYLNNLGYAHLKKSQPNRARKLLERAYEIEPENQQVRNNLMVAMALTGDQATVLKVLNEMEPADRTKMVKLIRSFSQNG
ncbi:MAG: tetratricopeptide repeat protein [Alphaproteobacteria bacterium]